MTYALLISFVKERFESINEFLSQSPLKAESIQELATLHYDITEIVQSINGIYSSLVMLYFANIFVIFNLFVFSFLITKNYYEMSIATIFTALTNVECNVYTIALFTTIINCAAKSAAEGSNTAKLIYQIINKTPNKKIVSRVNLKSNLLKASYISFSSS